MLLLLLLLERAPAPGLSLRGSAALHYPSCTTPFIEAIEVTASRASQIKHEKPVCALLLTREQIEISWTAVICTGRTLCWSDADDG